MLNTRKYKAFGFMLFPSQNFTILTTNMLLRL